MTFRELVWSERGARKVEWAQTSAVLAVIINANPYRKGRAVKPDELNPYSGKKDTGWKITAKNISVLKALLPKAGCKKVGGKKHVK